MNNILIISYLFPPMGGIGVQRALSLTKYLPACGYNVHVLKATNAGGPVYDPDLVRHIPASVQVHQAFTPEVPFSIRQKLWAKLSGGQKFPGTAAPKSGGRSLRGVIAGAIKKVLCPEPEILWVPFAVRKARRIIRRNKIDVVLVTVPPFSALVVGTILKREFPSLKLVSDFRDEWLSFYLKDFEFQNSDHTRSRAEKIEREAVERSDLIVAVNNSSRDEIRRRYPDQDEAKFVVLPNGYDPEVFRGFTPRVNGSSGMVVTHVGTVYKTASPRFYLNALDELSDDIRSRVETRFIGRISDNERILLQGRRSKVEVIGFMPQNEALKFMEETDYLLLTMTNEISVPGKLFEYMAARKPVLALAPPGSEVDRILRETRAGVCAPPNDHAAIKQMLTDAFTNFMRSGHRTYAGDAEAVRRYERPRLVREYGRMIENL